MLGSDPVKAVGAVGTEGRAMNFWTRFLIAIVLGAAIGVGCALIGHAMGVGGGALGGVIGALGAGVAATLLLGRRKKN